MMISEAPQQPAEDNEVPRYYSAGGGDEQERFNRPRPNYNQGGGYQNREGGGGYQNRGGYGNREGGGGGYQNRQQGGYNRDNRGGYGGNRPQGQGGYQNREGGGGYQNRGGYGGNRPQGGGGYGNRPQQGGGGYQNRGGYGGNRPQQGGGYNRQGGGGYGNRPQGGGYGNRPQQRRPQSRAPKQLLISREQMEQIELLYKLMLPLPNPDAHEAIGEKIGLEPRKVFFGINLVRQKMMLPKLPFPKRKLAISPDQLFAIKNLYEPLLPLPPIGCHKIIASQLKMDEWRVHVGIGLVRSQMGMQRWNQERPECPAEFKNQAKEEKAKKPTKADKEPKEKKEAKPKKAAKAEVTEEVAEDAPKKRGRPKKADA